MTAKVVTFYSYKGGVGRTQALANVAVGLANRGKNVVAVDMDLESPGLHNFFYPSVQEPTRPLRDHDLAGKAGFIDFLEDCARLPREEPRIEALLLACSHPNLRPGMGWLRIVPAGRLSEDYPERIGAFSWERFYQEQGGYQFMELFRDHLVQSGADYVLVDSRTGMTDVANVCTFQLPDIVVVLFALHEQGIEGAYRAARAIQEARQDEATAPRLQRVVLLPSRVEEAGDPVVRDDWVLRARARLADSGTLLLDLGQRVPYAPESAYGEVVVVDAGEPSNLSRAYDRLLEEILGASRPPSVPAPKRVRFKELRADVDRLEQNALALVRELDTVTLPDLPLTQMRRFAHEIIRKRNNLVDEARKIRDALRALAAASPTTGEPPDVDVEAFESAKDWTVIVRRLREALEAQLIAWAQAERRRLELELLEVAEQDAALVAGALDELQPWIDAGESEEIETRLSGLRETISQNTLEAFLRRNTLDTLQITRRLPDPSERKTWLDGRLDRLLSESTFDVDMTAMLSNLLRLRAELGGAPAHRHWSAYEALCARVHADKAASEHIFATIGSWLWDSAWGAIFSGPSNVDELRAYAGPESRKNLALVLQSSSDAGQRLVRSIAQGLIGLWNQGKRGVIRDIVRRIDDAGLRAALEALEETGAPPQARREIVAARFRVTDVMTQNVRLVRTYLEALVEEGCEAEAFYALAALRELGAAEHIDRLTVDLAFLVRALEHGQGSVVAPLLMSPETEHLASSRTGKVLLLLLAWQPWRFHEDVRQLAPHVRTVLTHAEAREPNLPPEFLKLMEEPIEIDVSLARKIRAAEDAIRTGFRTNRFRGNWEASRHYEVDFHALVEERLEALLRSVRPRDAEIQHQSDVWNSKACDAWVESAYSAQRAEGIRTSFPEDAARKSIVATFADARERFVMLAGLRQDSGHPSLGDTLRMALNTEHSTRLLRDWLLSTPEQRPLEHSLAQRVAHLLAHTSEVA